MTRAKRNRRVAEIIRRTIADLPPPLRAALEEENVTIDLVEEPPEELGDAFGSFAGGSRYDLSSPETLVAEPPRIELYLSSFAALSGEDFEEEVRRTVVHEIGHFLGFDEDALADV